MLHIIHVFLITFLHEVLMIVERKYNVLNQRVNAPALARQRFDAALPTLTV
jgi:hypothetical protein